MAQKYPVVELFKEIFNEPHIIQYEFKDAKKTYTFIGLCGPLFQISFNIMTNQHDFKHGAMMQPKYKKYDLPTGAHPNLSALYDETEYEYTYQKMVKDAQRNINTLYQTLLNKSDILMQMHGDFETYTCIYDGDMAFRIGYDESEKKYFFKQYAILQALYKTCDIPTYRTPNYESLYKKAKNLYMAQFVIENIQHLHDI